MATTKRTDFETWNPDYDIPDDPKPLEEKAEYGDREEFRDAIYFKTEMRDSIQELRTRAMNLNRKQNDYWDNYGDNYKLEEIVDFIIENKEDILGIVRNANWLAKVDVDNWEYQFDLYYDTLLAFIERSKFAIKNYDKQIRDLKKKLK